MLVFFRGRFYLQMGGSDRCIAESQAQKCFFGNVDCCSPCNTNVTNCTSSGSTDAVRSSTTASPALIVVFAPATDATNDELFTVIVCLTHQADVGRVDQGGTCSRFDSSVGGQVYWTNWCSRLDSGLR